MSNKNFLLSAVILFTVYTRPKSIDFYIDNPCRDTLSSSVSFSFLSLSLSTAFSSQRRAFALRSLAPPEITPDFWKRVPSKATVLKRKPKFKQRKLLCTWKSCSYVCVCRTRCASLAHLMPVRPSKGNPACILDILTHESISTGILQGFLNVRWLVADHVNHQLGPSQLPQFLICGFYLQGRNQLRLKND